MQAIAAEGSGIDMDQTSTTAIPAAVRPPAALLALESTSSATGGDAGNYRVSACLWSQLAATASVHKTDNSRKSNSSYN